MNLSKDELVKYFSSSFHERIVSSLKEQREMLEREILCLNTSHDRSNIIRGQYITIEEILSIFMNLEKQKEGL